MKKWLEYLLIVFVFTTLCATGFFTWFLFSSIINYSNAPEYDTVRYTVTAKSVYKISDNEYFYFGWIYVTYTYNDMFFEKWICTGGGKKGTVSRSLKSFETGKEYLGWVLPGDPADLELKNPDSYHRENIIVSIIAIIIYASISIIVLVSLRRTRSRRVKVK